MKHMRKILALALALVMVMGLAITASAYTITMAPSADGSGVAGHTYEVYQIYTGTMSEIDGKETLGEVKYGQDYADKTVGDLVPEEELEEIEALSGAAAAERFEALIDDSPIATLNDGNSHTSADLAPGYYLIIDVSENLPEGETSSAFILEVLDDMAIKSKHTSSPITEKKIDDTNDSVDAVDSINWQDSADHDIGDAIPFQLKMVVPSAFDAFADYNANLEEGEERIPYRFVFHDTEEAGLTFKNDAKVYVDGVQITSGYEVIYPATDGHTFDVVFADMTTIDAIKVGSTVTVEYKSELNESAILGSQGNVNEVYGEFSNLHRPEYPGFTPKDTVIAFTYKVVVNKVDEKGEALTGATFTLEKYNKATDSWVAIKQVETEPGAVFTFKGLDDGNYRLTETKAPDGYNKIEAIEFTVTADHDILWETQDRADVLNSLTGKEAGNVETGEIEPVEITFTALENIEGLTTNVENKAGVVLPETGGIGTTIFYILGGLLAVVAVVLLVTKKRMKSAE